MTRALLEFDDATLPGAHRARALLDSKPGRPAPGFEVRAGVNGFAAPIEFPFPRWQGETLEGRRLLLVGEQGRGDQIQFIRYAAVLRERGAAAVDALVRPELADLLAGAPGVGRTFPVVTHRASDYDYWSFLLSVPGRVGTALASIPAPIPYLRAEAAAAARWGERIEALAAGRRRLGLVWAGSPGYLNDRYRSMRLKVLAPLLELEGAAWFSLQKGSAEAELEALPGRARIHALGPALENFSQTAAVLANLELLICVDTAAAHLAGALAKPCWVLLPSNPDRRWMLEREDSPWYPGVMRLFRQTAPGRWAPVVERVREALRTLVLA